MAGMQLWDDAQPGSFVGKDSAGNLGEVVIPRTEQQAVEADRVNVANRFRFLMQTDSDCHLHSSCGECTGRWPDCAWCATSGTCRRQPTMLQKHLQARLRSSWGHVVYSREEYAESYGVARSSDVVEDPDCGVWFYNPQSCTHVADYCEAFDDCATCTALGGCGFCYAEDTQARQSWRVGGRCLPGTASGEFAFSQGEGRCRPLSSATSSSAKGTKSPNNSNRAWLFGNWPKYYSQGSWENQCIEKCPREQRFTKPSGFISMGNRALRVSYPMNANCSWVISPNPWPEGKELVVDLQMDGIRYQGDVLQVTMLDGSRSGGSYVGCLKTFNEGVGLRSCVNEKTIRSLRPIKLHFQSYNGGPTMLRHGASWTATWLMLPIGLHRDGRGSYSAQQAADDHFQFLWLVLISVVVLVPSLFFLFLFRRWRGQETLQVGLPVGAASEAATVRSDTVPIDLVAVERELESFRPYTLETPQGFCSVCLTELEIGEEVRRLPCTHCFHKGCGDVWFLRKLHCPLCRQQICPWPPANYIAPSRAAAPQPGDAIASTASVPENGRRAADNGTVEAVVGPVVQAGENAGDHAAIEVVVAPVTTAGGTAGDHGAVVV